MIQWTSSEENEPKLSRIYWKFLPCRKTCVTGIFRSKLFPFWQQTYLLIFVEPVTCILLHNKNTYIHTHAGTHAHTPPHPTTTYNKVMSFQRVICFGKDSNSPFIPLSSWFSCFNSITENPFLALFNTRASDEFISPVFIWCQSAFP